MVSQSILFAINTTGGGKAKLQFMAVAAGVAIAAKAFAGFAKEAQSLHQTFIQLSDANRAELAELEKLNKGIIDTGATMKMFATLNKAGMEDTGDLMKAMTKIVIDEGQKTGKTAQQITDDFNQLGEGIAKGSGRQLKKFGVDLQETEDLLLMQEEALWKVQDRAEGLTVELRTLSEQTFAAKNSWDTYTQLLFGSITAKGALTETIRGLDDASEAMILAGENTEELKKAQVIGALAGYRWGAQIIGNTVLTDAYNKKIEMLIGSMRRLTKINATVEKFTAGVSEGGGYRETAELDPFDPFFEEGGSTDMGAREDLGAKSIAATKAAAKKPRGGGGAKAAPALVGEEKWAAELALDQARKEEQIAHNEWRLINDADYLDRMIAQEMEADAELLKTYRGNTAAWNETQEDKWQLQLVTDENERALEVEHHEWSLLNDAHYREQYLLAEQAKNDADIADAKRVKDAKVAFAQSTMQGIGGIFTNLSSLMQSQHKRQFELGKKAAYAATVVNTAAAAMGAFKSLASIPYVGVALGIAAAAAAVTAGGIQLATIKRQKFGSGGGGVSAGAVGSGGGGYLGGGGNYAAGGAAPQTTHITLVLGEEKFQEWFVDMNDKASQQGKPAFEKEAA